jgi:uncharacterized membrane protein
MRELLEIYQITGMGMDDVIFVLQNFGDLTLRDMPLLVWVLPIQAQVTLFVLTLWFVITTHNSLEDAKAVWRGEWTYRIFLSYRMKEAVKSLLGASLLLLILLGAVELVLAISIAMDT